MTLWSMRGRWRSGKVTPERNETEKGTRENPAEEGRKKPSTSEFLSGFWAEDRLIPSITVTIFFGPEEWDGPLSLFDMMDMPDPDVLACMDNYHVRLIAPAQMADEEIMKFQSSLREVMLFIKYSKDKENLSRVLAANERRRRLDSVLCFPYAFRSANSSSRSV